MMASQLDNLNRLDRKPATVQPPPNTVPREHVSADIRPIVKSLVGHRYHSCTLREHIYVHLGHGTVAFVLRSPQRAQHQQQCSAS
jgi:hypothetical protein